MKLLTKTVVRQLLKKRRVDLEQMYSDGGKVIMEIYHPLTGATWLVTGAELIQNRYDMKDILLTAYVNLGLGFGEFGSVYFSELVLFNIGGIGLEVSEKLKKGITVGERKAELGI